MALNLARLAETILTVFTQERELLPWQLFQQILLNYDSIMQGVYTDLAQSFDYNKIILLKAFSLADMANMYSLRKALAVVSQQNFDYFRN